MDAYKNFAYSTVAVPPSPSNTGTVLTVAPGGGALFAEAPFNATVCPSYVLATAYNAEIVRVVSIAGDTLTIIRQQEGSGSHPIAVGDTIAGVITQKTLMDLANAAAGVKFSAGTLSSIRTDITFANSNGLSFGLNTNGQLTATVGTDYQSTGNYLTTAALSQDTSNYAGTHAAMTGGSITVNTSGISINLPPYLTTADLSQNSSNYAGTNGAMIGGSITVNTFGVSISLPPYLTTAINAIEVSAGVSSSNVSVIQFSNTNGVSFGYDGTNITATVATNYQSQGPYLTTADLSQNSSNYAGTNAAIIGGSITVNTSGVSISLPAYLTTADLSQNSSNYAGTNGAITGGSITVNTSGVSVALPAYLTTADLSQNSSNYAGTDGAMTGGSITVNTSGVSINLPSYLTTAALSQNSSNYAGINAAMTGGSITVNTSGVSINLPSYLTTAALSQNSSNYAGTAGAMTGGSITVNTSGVSINLPSYLTTAMQSNAVTISNINVSAGTTSSNISAVTFSNSNGVTFGIGSGASAGIVTASVAQTYLSFFENVPFPVNTSWTGINQSAVEVQPFILPQAVSCSYIRVPVSCSFANSSTTGDANTSMSQAWFSFRSDFFVIYTQGTGTNSMNLLSVTSGAAAWTFSNLYTNNPTDGGAWGYTDFITYPTLGGSSTAQVTWSESAPAVTYFTTLMSNFASAKYFDYPLGVSLSAGNYWIAFGLSGGTSTSGSGNTTTSNITGFGMGGVSRLGANLATVEFGQLNAVNFPASLLLVPGLGSYSTNAALFAPASIALSNISLASAPTRIYFQMKNTP